MSAANTGETITYKSRGKQTLVISGTKGSDIVDHLVECVGGINPLIACYEAVEKLDLATLSPADLVCTIAV